MVLLDINIKPTSSRSFDCELYCIENEEKQIKTKFEPLVIVRNIRQICRISLPNFNKLENEYCNESNNCSFNKNSNFNISDSNNNFINVGSNIKTFFENDEIINNTNEYERIFNSRNHANDTSSYINNTISSPTSSTLNSSFYNFCGNNVFNKKDVAKNNQSFYLNRFKKFAVKFEFKNFPEYLELGDFVVINESFMKAYGYISNIDT